MSQPANDVFLQHLSDDEASNHEDASDHWCCTKQQQKVIPTTAYLKISNSNSEENEEYEIWDIEKEHYLEYIDNDVLEDSSWNDDAKEIWGSHQELEGLEKGYDRFQQLLSQLEAHGAEVSTEDANHILARYPILPQEHLQELKNVAFVSQSKSSTNKVKSGFTGAYSTCTPSTSSTNIPEKEALAGFADEVIYSLFAKQSEDWDLLHEDLEQIDDLDIEEMDINWQIA
ncbi:hypothetical protein Tco_1312075 [Tanacetum coccineum]